MTKARIPEIDIMKGIAILCVILEHIDNCPEILKHLITSFHMPLFFIIAGFFYRPQNCYKEKFKKDLNRLIIPYIATMAILSAYSFFIHFILKSDHSRAYLTFWCCLFPSGIKGSSLSNSVPVWFLCALFWCRQIYNLIFVKYNKPIAILLIVIISSSVTFLYEETSIEFPLSFIQGISAMIFYLFGWFIRQFLDRHNLNASFLILTWIIWLTCFQYCGIGMITCYYNNFFLALVVAVCGTFSIYSISKIISNVFTISIMRYVKYYLKWAGISSLVILCVHTIEMYLPIWDYIGLYSVIPLFLAKVVLCSVITLLCYKTKITRSIFQLK